MSKIFLSYRRSDSADVTGRIYDRFVDRFGAKNVFKDVDSIPLGVDFRAHMAESVEKCEALVVIIGLQWLDTAGQAGCRRLDDPQDFVRIEIETALQRGIRVLPVLVQGAIMPKAENLPPSLQQLAFQNATCVRPDPDFHRDMDRLIGDLESSLLRHQSELCHEGAADVSQFLEVISPGGCRYCLLSHEKPYEVHVTSITAAESRWEISGKGKIIRRRCPRCRAMYQAVMLTIPIECAPYSCPTCGEESALQYKVERITAERKKFTFEASITCRKCKEHKTMESEIQDMNNATKISICPTGITVEKS